MRTARLLAIFPSMHCCRGVPTPGGVCSWGGLLMGGSAHGGRGVGVPAPGGVPAPRGWVSQHALRQTPPCGQNDRHV